MITWFLTNALFGCIQSVWRSSWKYLHVLELTLTTHMFISIEASSHALTCGNASEHTYLLDDIGKGLTKHLASFWMERELRIENITAWYLLIPDR